VVTLLFEWTQVNLFNELWPDWKLLKSEGFDGWYKISHSPPVTMHKCSQPIKGVLLYFWLFLTL